VTGKYGIAVLQVVRLLSIVTVLAMALGIFMMKRRDLQGRRQVGIAALETDAALKLGADG
jgi:hypothetical protein